MTDMSVSLSSSFEGLSYRPRDQLETRSRGNSWSNVYSLTGWQVDADCYWVKLVAKRVLEQSPPLSICQFTWKTLFFVCEHFLQTSGMQTGKREQSKCKNCTFWNCWLQQWSGTFTLRSNGRCFWFALHFCKLQYSLPATRQLVGECTFFPCNWWLLGDHQPVSNPMWLRSIGNL